MIAVASDSEFHSIPSWCTLYILNMVCLLLWGTVLDKVTWSWILTFVSCCNCCIYRAITYADSAGHLPPVETTSMRISNIHTMKFNETEVFHEMKQLRRRRARVGGGFPIFCILISSSMGFAFVLLLGLELHFHFERFRRFILPRALELGKNLLRNFTILCIRKVCEFLRKNGLAFAAVGILGALSWQVSSVLWWPYGALLVSMAISVYALIMLWWPGI